MLSSNLVAGAKCWLTLMAGPHKRKALVHSNESDLFWKGDDRIRTGDQGFADPCLVHLATSPKNQTDRYYTCRFMSKRAKRFELSTFSLARRRSTTELHPRVWILESARTQTRTGDSCIFSAVLYQLSYPGRWSSDYRKASGILSNRSLPVKLAIGVQCPIHAKPKWGNNRPSEHLIATKRDACQTQCFRSVSIQEMAVALTGTLGYSGSRLMGVVVSRWMPRSSKSVAGRPERAAVGSTPIHSRLKSFLAGL